MKIVLVAINSKFVHSSLAVWCLAGVLEKYAPSTKYEIIEATINEQTDEITRRIITAKADIVGFSTYIWNKTLVLQISKSIKELTGAKILLGGPEVSYNTKEIMENNPFVDYVISGEGERPISRLCNGEDLDDIEGLSFRAKDGICIKDPYVSKEDPPNPYVDDYFKRLNGRITYIETSRGCPYHCAFCLSGRCGGVRFFDLEASKEKILLLANSGTRTVKFVDRTFNADRKRAIEIFEFLIENYKVKIPEGVCFHFEIEGELIDEHTVNVLSRAPKGFIQFEIGIQSFNEKTLKCINRKTNLVKLKENIAKLLELKNIHIHIDLIAGLPYEDWNSIENSFNEAYKLNPHMLQLGFLKLLHGAEMREEINKYKTAFSDTPPYEITSNDWLNEHELEKLHLFEDVFEKLYNSGRFAYTIEYLNGLYQNHFEMYLKLSLYIGQNCVIGTLDEFTKTVYQYFIQDPSVDSKILRDVMAIDRLATNRMGALPEFLKIKSEILKKCLNELEKNEETRRPRETKRAATVLASEKKIVYVDYVEFDPITKRYKTKFLDINE